MKILLALDSSQKTAQEAVRVAGERKACLTALFVLDGTWAEYIGHDWLSGSNARAGFLDYIEENEQALAKRTIEEFRQTAGAMPVEIKTAAGRVPEVILRELGNGYDLLVMSAPFKRGLEILRNAPAAIMKDAPCSVFLVA